MIDVNNEPARNVRQARKKKMSKKEENKWEKRRQARKKKISKKEEDK